MFMILFRLLARGAVENVMYCSEVLGTRPVRSGDMRRIVLDVAVPRSSP